MMPVHVAHFTQTKRFKIVHSACNCLHRQTGIFIRITAAQLHLWVWRVWRRQLAPPIRRQTFGALATGVVMLNSGISVCIFFVFGFPRFPRSADLILSVIPRRANSYETHGST